MTKISNLTAATSALATDEFALARTGTSRKLVGSELAPWEKILDLPLTASTNWSMPAGFTNDGTKMLVGVNTPQIRNAYSVRLPLDHYIAQCEIQLPNSSRSASDQRAGLILNWNGSGTGSVLCLLRWNAKAAATYYDERDGADGGANESVSGGLAVDTWHTLRVVRAGFHTTAYVNGVLQRVSRIDPHAGAVSVGIHFLGLYGYQIDAWFRNLKVWRPMMPV